MEKKKVIVVEHIDESGIKVLEESNLAEIIYYDGIKSKETYLKDLKSAHALLVRITELNGEMIRSAEHLKIISKHGVGFDNIDVPAATDRKIPVTITPGANSDAVAEHALAMMFAMARNIRSADSDLKERQFTKRQNYIHIFCHYMKNINSCIIIHGICHCTCRERRDREDDDRRSDGSIYNRQKEETGARC